MADEPSTLRLDQRLALTFGAFTGFLLLTLGVAAVGITSYSIEQEQGTFVDAIAFTLADSVEGVGFSGKYHTRQLFESLVHENEALVFLSLVDPGGTIIAHSDPELNGTPLGDNELTLSAEELAEGTPIKFVGWRGNTWVTEVDIPVRGGFQNQVIGVLKVGVRTKTWWQRFMPTAPPILLVTLVLLGLAIPIFQRLSRQFASPVRRQALRMQALLAHSPLFISMRESGQAPVLESSLLQDLRSRSSENAKQVDALLSDESAVSGHVSQERLMLDGTQRTLVSSRFMVDIPGGQKQHVWIASDTTALHRAAGQRDRFASAVAASPNAVALVDSLGAVNEVNPAFCEILGYPRSTVSGLEFWSIVANDEQVNAREIHAVLAGGTPWRGVLRLQHADGSVGPFMVGLVPLGDGGVAVTARDVAREIALRDQLQQSQKMEAVGRLAGGVAHDFNNLLTVILVVSELSKLRMTDPAAIEDMTAIIHAAERGKELTGQLLSFSRAKPRNPEIMSLSRLIDESMPLVERLVSGEIAVEVELPSDLWPIYADQGQLHQVLMNLCVNANDAMEAGGTLRISAQNIDASPGDDVPTYEVEFAVSDTGHGIPEALLSQICEPFFTTKPVGKGTGLGLSIVHGIIEQNGGRLLVESDVGVGTTFRVRIPRSPENADNGESVNGVPGGHEHILVVDDEPGVREAIARTLRGAGYTVNTADGGDTAIQMLERGPLPMAMLTDLAMPGMSGVILGQLVTERWPEVGIVYMSGFSAQFPEVSDKPLLAKPPTSSELRLAIRRVLDLTTDS